MPFHDETSPVAPRAGSVRRPAPARTRSTGGGGGRPPAGGRARTSAARGGTGSGGPPRPPRPPGSPGARPGGPRGTGPRNKKQRRRRRLKILAGLVAGMLLLLGVFVGVVYASTTVPSPDSIRSAQTTVVYYSDGTTEMARLGDENRTNVTLAQVSKPAQDAVLAAENRSFYSDPGISFTGILRATFNNLTGGSTQGGSTITQQYVKNAILKNSAQTFTRKFKELFLSIKLDNNFSKQQILENYLNTIYYGRGAYGIEAAANTYFGVPAAQLTPQQGAVLAVLIRSPSHYDPEVSPQDARARWGDVLDGMAAEHWITAEERAGSVYPPVLPKAAAAHGLPKGPEGLIVSQVRRELQQRYKYSEQQIDAGGLRITTTIDKKYQDAAVKSVEDVMTGEDRKTLREALVSVDPKTGAVTAYYGGPSGTDYDFAQAQRQPGSSMKPYVLATALQQGISVDARRDGSSPQTFKDRPTPVVNSGGASCPACTLTEAITRSLNTTFYGLAYEVGPANVRKTALAATGLPDVWQTGELGKQHQPVLANSDGKTGSAIGIGEYELRPIDQAVGFATFADGGIQRDPYFVSKVTDSEAKQLFANTGDPGKPVIDPQVANDVSFALKGVAAYSKRPLDGGREVASKTGTQGLNRQDNSDAWMVGYTPSISTAVWMGTAVRDPIVNANGGIIYGSGLPGEIWQEFMNTVLKGTPKEKLPSTSLIKGDTGVGVPDPTPVAPAPVAPVAPPTTSAPSGPPGTGNTGTGTGRGGSSTTAPNTGAPNTTAPNTGAPSTPTGRPGGGAQPGALGNGPNTG